MSKRCELQKEYYKEFGNYKGEGKYSDHYVEWLESKVLGSCVDDVVERFSGENLQKQQQHFVNLYGSGEMAQEKANSFAVGFGKACELIIKDLNDTNKRQSQ